jgi:hypothetical protein
MYDSADPLHGWSTTDVANTSSGPAVEDIYGKLFYHIRASLRAFLLRLSNLQASFQLLQLNAAELPNHLEPSSFSRIEVSTWIKARWVATDTRRTGIEYLRQRISQNTSHNLPHGTSA